ncbi:flagellar hook-basal body complex protein FliE [Rhizomicrobium palustre]|jgi:flagellar hook-basal body complex protein FliE|uniref:Flagellar hook-basal body complex protein FliE n=1 Tax=Rhizomicrobium palustre TaxID=189966 RepID=A0A846MXK5_9PROT|nr:flagellar hook-basal body complex protein FliE [Rhizomicrobium palustre]NIK88314.1 flagellar hook-basal body complex protein FliE [Rhizomicrobium palustre]
MAVLPAAAAAAYQSIAKMGSVGGAGDVASAAQTGAGGFGDFLSDALKSSIDTMKQGEKMAGAGVAGKADIVDVVNAVNQAEITLDTVVAVRDKVVAAYQSIMNMPI